MTESNTVRVSPYYFKVLSVNLSVKNVRVVADFSLMQSDHQFFTLQRKVIELENSPSEPS